MALLEKPLFLRPQLGDDIGYANVGWHRKLKTREVQTPVLDALVAEGIELTNFYAFKYCSPSRSAFISGRNPIHVQVWAPEFGGRIVARPQKQVRAIFSIEMGCI